MEKNNSAYDVFDVILYALSAIIGIFIGIQIVRMLLGGSWSLEQVIIGLLIFNLTATLTVFKTSIGNKHDLRNLERAFGSLAKDFKDHLKDSRKGKA